MPIVRFVRLSTPPELEQAIGDGIHSCGMDGEHLARLHAGYAQAVDEGWPEAAVYERLQHAYRTAFIQSRQRRQEIDRLIEMARVFLVGLSLN